MAAKLQQLNFKLINDAPLLNANKQQIKQAVQDFTTQLRQGDLGLFFYAGHGMQVDGVNYLVPLGAEFKSKADIAYNAVNLDWVLAELGDAKNSINFILLDACRDNPFRGFRSSKRGLGESRAPEGSLIFFATGPGKAAADGMNQRNSPYTRALLKALDKPGVEVLSLFKAVRRDVKKYTDNEQTPWESHSLTADVYFNGKPEERIATEQHMLQQLSAIRKQQQVTEQQLAQALTQQQQAQSSTQKQQAESALTQARAAAERIRTQAQSIGINISPSALADTTQNDFEKELLLQQQAFVLAQNKKTDVADYAKTKAEHTSVAYLHYLKNCSSPCAYSVEAEAAYKQLETKHDLRAYQRASNKSSSAALRHYLQNCNIICAYQQPAQENLKISKQTELEASQDKAYYAQARKLGTVPALAAYLSSCKICIEMGAVKQDWPAQKIAQLPSAAAQRFVRYREQSIATVIKNRIAAVAKAEPKAQAAVKTQQEYSLQGMVKIPSGCFRMGSSVGESDEKPVHPVCISKDFELGQYEVTQAQWEKIMGNNPASFKGSNRPVENVSWDDVQQFISKLNQITGQNYRLPTEAEWEYACRSGGKDETYCGSNKLDSVAWYNKNSDSQTHRVGQKQANGLGLYDMSGNVWEWVQDQYRGSYYGESPQYDPTGSSGGSDRVGRGGSWDYYARFVRSALRGSDSPSNSSSNLGFRLARTP